MQIKVLTERTKLPDKTIRYYESIGLLPSPNRQPNGYRDYSEADVERVKFVAGARHLDFSLDDIAEILALRDRREAPCRVVLELLEQKADEVNQRIAELQRLEAELRQLRALGLTFPTDDVDGKACVCHLITQKANEPAN
ncbi:MAG: heavy metal-responsive transcriptional regulator [Chloroflexi bacterium]|nr:heavy metal-responsive transcriptional regulator [Chloroflexota bacterium]MCI0575044.1 heavy metal-responsive transcriptional regulator [Chloroflexota bacterium]MCI0645121.1 heavy metal-responsive transcriptional regulator [Chloroflexota bacterium]MCI0726796.1 heavy metal-responsive transcriptional regulator [Chloroflexota bacterium]